MLHPNAGGSGSIAGQGTRPQMPLSCEWAHMPPLKPPHATTKRSCMPQLRPDSQTSLKKERERETQCELRQEMLNPYLCGGPRWASSGNGSAPMRAPGSFHLVAPPSSRSSESLKLSQMCNYFIFNGPHLGIYSSPPLTFHEGFHGPFYCKGYLDNVVWLGIQEEETGCSWV